MVTLILKIRCTKTFNWKGSKGYWKTIDKVLSRIEGIQEKTIDLENGIVEIKGNNVSETTLDTLQKELKKKKAKIESIQKRQDPTPQPQSNLAEEGDSTNSNINSAPNSSMPIGTTIPEPEHGSEQPESSEPEHGSGLAESTESEHDSQYPLPQRGINNIQMQPEYAPQYNSQYPPYQHGMYSGYNTQMQSEYSPQYPAPQRGTYSGYNTQMQPEYAPQLFSDENPNACFIM